MNDPLIIEVDREQADRWFAELLRRGASLAPLMADIGEVLTESTQKRFDAGMGPDGTPWVPLADGSGRTPLNDSGRTRGGIFPTSGDDWVEISADSRQARWHQEGTKPYVILPKDKKALNWPGGPGPRRKVNHPGLPARPFMGLSADDGQMIEDLAAIYLEEAGDA